MENTEHDETMEPQGGKIKRWFQDNSRIIFSILVVIFIAAGIYSYSRRAEAPAQPRESTEQEEFAVSEGAMDEGQIQIESPGEPAGTVAVGDGQQVEKKETPATVAVIEDLDSMSQETEKTYVEKSARGNGTTHLARRALAHYLEKNPDSELKTEHKIYIEDYLRKKVGKTGRLLVGESVEFEKELIAQAITEAKSLNERQVQNLSKYVPLVPSLA